jgi:TPR repeat protein
MCEPKKLQTHIHIHTKEYSTHGEALLVTRSMCSSFVLLSVSTVVVPARPPLPLALGMRDACAAAFGVNSRPEPEEAAAVACAVIAALHTATSSSVVERPEALPKQGEYIFSADTPFAGRFACIEPFALAGDPLAAQTLGLLLFSGVGGCSSDLRASAKWHAASAAQGNLDALAVLGGCIRRGSGVEQDEAMGRAIIEATAAAGSPVGLCKLGVMLDEGQCGMTQDSWAAARCFEAAAAQASALGQFNWGWALVHGIGVRRDVRRGIEQWVQAMKQAPLDGSEEAAFYLYEERSKIDDPALYDAIRPTACLRLAASLELDLAIERLARAEERRKTKQVVEAFRKPRKGPRFTRDDKARQWTAKDQRAAEFLDALDG